MSDNKNKNKSFSIIIKDKSDNDIKNEILSKMRDLKSRNNYIHGPNYYDLFFDIVKQSCDSNNNMIISIEKDKTKDGIIYTLTEEKESSEFSGALAGIIPDFSDITGTSETEDIQSIMDNSAAAVTGDSSAEIITGVESTIDTSGASVQDSSVQDSLVQDSSVQDSSVQDSSVQDSSVQGSSTTEEPKKSGIFGNFGLWGGNKNSYSDYESDGSVISSDDELEDIVPYMTAVFDDEEEEDLMDYVKNMRSKKYLKKLTNIELRETLRKNNQTISKNNNYLSKKDMIASVIKFYK